MILFLALLIQAEEPADPLDLEGLIKSLFTPENMKVEEKYAS